ncbi:MAG: hypothetical protein U0841_31775 [Chloroflexia bacterium]
MCYDERRAPGWAALAAAALGFLFLTRELGHRLCRHRRYLPAWRGHRRLARRERTAPAGARIVAAVAGLAPFVAAYLLYNRALTGSALLLPRTLFSASENRYGFGEGVGFFGRHTLGGGLVNADEMLTLLAITLFGWPFFVALAAMVLLWALRRARAWDALHGALALGFVLAYIGLYYHGITYGPRYLDALPALVLLAARGFVALAETAAALCQDCGRTRARDRANLAALLLVVASSPATCPLLRPAADAPLPPARSPGHQQGGLRRVHRAALLRPRLRAHERRRHRAAAQPMAPPRTAELPPPRLRHHLRPLPRPHLRRRPARRLPRARVVCRARSGWRPGRRSTRCRRPTPRSLATLPLAGQAKGPGRKSGAIYRSVSRGGRQRGAVRGSTGAVRGGKHRGEPEDHPPAHRYLSQARLLGHPHDCKPRATSLPIPHRCSLIATPDPRP